MKISILSLSLITIATTIYTNAMNFSINKNYMGYNLIYAYGNIRYGDTYKLKRKYNQLSKNRQTLVIFNSNGGILDEGIKLGKFLKSNHLGSAVKQNGVCASSCAIAFLGGTSRSNKKLMILPSNAQLGFHSFYYSKKKMNVEKVQKDMSKILRYASYVNTPSSLLANMFSTTSKHIYWIRGDDRIVLNIKRGLRKLKIRSTKANSKSNKYRSVSNRKKATKYVKEYISKINSYLYANRGLKFRNSSYAYNNLNYNSWIGHKLRYIKLKSIKLKSHNRVEAKVIYSLKNGQRICATNTYKLSKNYKHRWKILNKKTVGCNYRSRKILKKLNVALP